MEANLTEEVLWDVDINFEFMCKAAVACSFSRDLSY